MPRHPALRFTSHELLELKQIFAQQLFTVAALFATSQEDESHFEDAVADAIELYDELLEQLER